MPFLENAEPGGWGEQAAERPVASPAGLPALAPAPLEVNVQPPSFGRILDNAIDTVPLRELGDRLRRPAGSPPDPDFDPFSMIRGYEDYAANFMHDNSPDDVALTKLRIDKERRQHEFREAAGWHGVVADLAVGLFDPVNLIPIGGEALALGRGARVAQSAFRWGRGAAVGTTINEGIAQASEETRTLRESAFNIAAATLMGGVLGAATGGFGKLR